MIGHSNWYVVYTFPNCERKIYNELSRRDITAFLPTRKTIRQWHDRVKSIEVPLFPNYVFVQVPHREIWSVLAVNGIVRFVSCNGVPVRVLDKEMDWVKKLTNSSNNITNVNCCVVGERVRVKKGPLMGLEGKVIEGVTKLFVEFKIMNQVVSVDIHASMLEKVQGGY